MIHTHTHKTAADSHIVVTISPISRAGLEEDWREQCVGMRLDQRCALSRNIPP